MRWEGWEESQTAFKQRPYISVERPESHHQLQDPFPSTEANRQLAEDLNKFYCRIEKQKPGLTPHTHSDRLTTQPSTPYPLPPLHCFSACTQDLWRWCKQSLQETEDKESQRPRWCLSSLPQSLCCPAIIHLHIDLQQITGAVWSPLLLQTLHYHPCPQETKNHRN